MSSCRICVYFIYSLHTLTLQILYTHKLWRESIFNTNDYLNVCNAHIGSRRVCVCVLEGRGWEVREGRDVWVWMCIRNIEALLLCVMALLQRMRITIISDIAIGECACLNAMDVYRESNAHIQVNEDFTLRTHLSRSFFSLPSHLARDGKKRWRSSLHIRS